MNYKRFLLICTLAIATLTVGWAQSSGDKSTILVACDWDSAPYEFINSMGESDGFNIELLRTIFTELALPHKFVMTSRKHSLELFRDHKADLIIDYRGRFDHAPYFHTLNAIDYYNIMLAYNKDSIALKSIDDLKGRIVMVNSVDDSLSRVAISRMLEGAQVEFRNAREALSGIEAGQYNYFVWGEELLEWKLKEYNLRNVAIGSLNIPAYEIHIAGHDKQLIDAIDNQFARLQQNGKVDGIRDKWFHPERVGTRTSSIVVYLGLATLLLGIMVLSIYLTVKARVRKALHNNEDMEAMMRKALSMGKYTVMMNNLKQKRVTNQHGHELPEEGISIEEMMEHIHPDDRAAMRNRSKLMAKAPNQSMPFQLRWNAGTRLRPEWKTISGYTYVEHDSHNRPINVVITSRDITDEIKKEENEREMTRRYMKMFDYTLVAMSFYDKEGNLIDLNENMKKLCGLNEENLEFFHKTKFHDVDLMKDDFDLQTIGNAHFCQHMKYPELGIDKYIEMRICTANDENGQLLFYIVTAREVTDERNMYLELQKQSQALSQAAATNRLYEHELRTLLEKCNMYVWHTDIKTGVISFARSLHSPEFSETLQEYADGMYEEHRAEALQTISNIKSLKQTFNVVHRFKHTPVTNTPKWFAISGMPLLNEEGEVTKLFGIVRDVTNLMETQQRLKEETARAENSAMLKATFLANMTHEIRTPLNAIVGFADVLQMLSTPEERKEVIRIIRNNCDMLMRLINDIFEASTIDVKPLTIELCETDFAAEFMVVCQSLAQRVQEPGVEFIVDAPYQSFVTDIDMGRVQQVVTNFVTNAVKYTHQGHIRVGYIKTPITADSEIATIKKELSSVNSEGLFIYCEDTGSGIPKSKQASVFERFVKLNEFVQGTGLGLAICKSIAERFGGKIGVSSEGEGHGSTFWIWIPCEQKQSLGN